MRAIFFFVLANFLVARDASQRLLRAKFSAEAPKKFSDGQVNDQSDTPTRWGLGTLGKRSEGKAALEECAGRAHAHRGRQADAAKLSGSHDYGSGDRAAVRERPARLEP